MGGTTPELESKTFLGHPRGLSTLFFTEMWERFSYYGMRAILVLYMTAALTGDNPGLHIDTGVAKAVYGTYVGLVYLTPIAGGWIADRLLGARRTVLYGGIVIACGHYLMAVPTEATFWLGLLTIALGTGLLKPNISAMVGKLYATEDTRRDAGFTLFYMGINLGSLLAPLVCGTLGERFNWHWGFGAAGVGMTIGLIQYVVGRKHLDGAGEDVDHPATEAEKRRALVILASVLITGAVLFFALKLFGQSNIGAVTTALTIVILMVPIWYFRQILSSTRGDATAGPRIRAFIWIFIAASLFWMIFEQAGSTLTVFADEVTNLAVTANFSLPVSWLQSLNPLYVVIFAPVFSVMLLRLGDRAPRTSIKFAIALLVVGFSFLLLILPMREFVNSGAQATVWWLVIVYLLQTWAELLLSPTGLSATTKLAPVGAVGMFMALWFLTSSVGTSVGGLIASWTDDYPVGSFAICGGMAVAFGLAMVMAAKKINASMGEVH